MKLSDTKVIFYAVGGVCLGIYLYYLDIFLQKNLWWIVSTIIYGFVFIVGDFVSKERDYWNKLKIKDRKDIRINFWDKY